MAQTVSEKLIETAENVFREFLREKDLKYTGERQKVLRAVMRDDEHFEAEQLLLDMRQASERVGKATVYRTLKLLVECGIVKEVRLSKKQMHYEHTYGEAPHDHMICLRCGRIIEFDAAEVMRLREEIAGTYRFLALSHRFAIMGVCNKCVTACPAGLGPLRPE